MGSSACVRKSVYPQNEQEGSAHTRSQHIYDWLSGRFRDHVEASRSRHMPFPERALDYCVSGIGPSTTRVDVAQSLFDQQKRYIRSGHKLPNPAAIVGCPAPKLGLFAKERRLLVLIGGGCDVVEPRLAKIRCCFNPHRQNAAGEMQGIGGLNL